MNLKNFNLYVYITLGVLLLLSLIWLIYSITNYFSINKDKFVKRRYKHYCLASMIISLLLFILVVLGSLRTYRLLAVDIPKMNTELTSKVNTLLEQVKIAIQKSSSQK